MSLSVWEVLFLGDPPEPQTMTGLTASPTMHFRRREDTLAAFQRVRFFVTLVHRFFFPLCVNDSGKSGRHVVKNDLDNYAIRLTICVFLCVYHIYLFCTVFKIKKTAFFKIQINTHILRCTDFSFWISVKPANTHFFVLKYTVVNWRHNFLRHTDVSLPYSAPQCSLSTRVCCHQLPHKRHNLDN